MRTHEDEMTMNLMRAVADGYQKEPVPMFLYHLRNYRERNAMLKWLLKNKITGENLAAWIVVENKKSCLATATEILKCLEHNVDKKIVLHKDYLPD